jgi:hypothetical protein
MVSGIGEVLNKLKSVKSLQKGEYQARCPAHEDSKPSLNLKQEGDSILLHCQAGCSPEAVCQSLGISTADLFIKNDKLPKSQLVKTYDYTDEAGVLLYQVCRYEPKSFKQRHPDGDKWSWNLNGTRRVVYNLPDVMASDTVYHVEGEKDADNLMTRGLVATTTCGGSGGWKSEYVSFYTGKKVIIIPDNDQPGYAYARSIIDSLAGKAKVKVIILPGGAKDVSDWLEAGNDISLLLGMEQEPNAINAKSANNAINAKNAIEANITNFANPVSIDDKPYQVVARLVRQYIDEHNGDSFDLDTICRHIQVTERDARRYVCIELARKIDQEKLEKVSTSRGPLYKVLSLYNEVKIDWMNANDKDIFPLLWPAAHDDPSYFPWDNVMVSPGDLIVLGGETNKGKTCLCLNIVWDNMDAYPVTLMGNAEYSAAKFKRRTKNMTWRDPAKDGKPKFELIRVTEDWKYSLRPDNINIIDWISLEGDFYRIGKLLEAMKSRMRGGVLIVSLQKGEGKAQAVGGHFTEDPADIYITMQAGHLTLKKVKEWKAPNPNGTLWAYDIIDGVRFAEIHQVLKCPACYGSGHRGSGECDKCKGKGFIDKPSVV